MNWTWKKFIWCIFVLLVLVSHLLLGTLLGIATAFYWLLERHFNKESPTGNPPAEIPERLWCVLGEHWIGNEPYSFYRETERHSADEAYCLKCKQGLDHRVDQVLKEGEELKAKEIEWELLTEDERESRRAAAKMRGTCPRCDKRLWLDDSDVEGMAHSKGSCPLCFEFPFRIGAPMNRGWREREWASLSESEKQARIEAARAKIEANLSGWAVKGNDGIWRRKDNGEVVKRVGAEATLLVESAKSNYGWPSETHATD